MHFFWREDGGDPEASAADELKHRSIAGGATTPGGTQHVVATVPGVAGDEHVATNAVYYDDDGVEVIRVAYVEVTSLDLGSATIRDDGTPTTDGDINDTDSVARRGGSPVASLAVEGKEVHALWMDDTTDDLWSSSSKDGAAWSAENEERDGITGSRISGNVYERDVGGGTLGPVLAFMLLVATPEYDEISLDDGTLTFANAGMAQRHLGRPVDHS